MQAVILAAGRGTRMKELTNETPKPLLEVEGRTLLEHKFEALSGSVDEIIIIIGYLGEKIQEVCGDSYNGIPISYVEQETLNGTGGALWAARPLLKDRFIVMMGDDLYTKEDIQAAIQARDWAGGVWKAEAISSGGTMILGEDGTIQEIVEGDHEGKPGFIHTGLLSLDIQVFDYQLVPKSEGSVEFGLPQTVLAASKEGGIPFYGLTATGWFQVTSPEDLARAESWIGGK